MAPTITQSSKTFVIHPSDLAYADDWYSKLKNLLDGEEAYQAILEEFYDQLAQ